MNIYEKLGPTCTFFKKIAEIQSWLTMRGVDSAQANTTLSFAGTNLFFSLKETSKFFTMHLNYFHMGQHFVLAFKWATLKKIWISSFRGETMFFMCINYNFKIEFWSSFSNKYQYCILWYGRKCDSLQMSRSHIQMKYTYVHTVCTLYTYTYCTYIHTVHIYILYSVHIHILYIYTYCMYIYCTHTVYNKQFTAQLYIVHTVHCPKSNIEKRNVC